MFSSYLHLEGPKETIAYGGDTKGEVIGVGNNPISQEYSIKNVLHVDLLGYNLLSISQLSDIGFDCHFSDKGVSVDGPYNKDPTIKTSGSRRVYNKFHAHF
jgi:hypothetical protein